MSDLMKLPESEKLAQLSQLAHAQILAAHDIEEAEAVLKAAKAKHRSIAEQDLPMLMDEIGISEFTTETGHKVEVSEKMTSSVAKRDMPAAVKWLTARGLEDIIKLTVLLKFAKGQQAEAAAARDALDIAGFGSELKEELNVQTVKAFVKEQLMEGKMSSEEMELFGVFSYRSATIKFNS